MPTELNPELKTLCEQRNLRRLNLIPPLRLTLTTPYPQFTQNKLDMRRKAEILKYDTSVQNKQLTKNEKWSRLVNKNTRNRGYSSLVNYVKDASGHYNPYVTRNDSRVCPEDRFISTPTSACGVPGKIINLTYDASVPLYNYATNNRSYAIINSDPNLSRNLLTGNDTTFPDGKENVLVTLLIGPNNNTPTHVYNITIPIGMYFVATQLNSSVFNKPISYSNSLSITSVKINVYFGNSLVAPRIIPNVYLSNNGTTYDFVDSSPPSANFDINFTPIKKEDSVQLSLFSGILHVENLELMTSPGFVYKIQAIFYLKSSTSNITFDSAFAYYGYGITANISLGNASVTQNCSIKLPNNYPIPTIFPSSTIS